MTEFETATLAFQEAQLAFQEAQLGLQERQLGLQFWQLWAAVAIPIVGLLQTLVVAWGIGAMIRSNKAQAEAEQRRAEAEVARHTEAMSAMDANHAATMRALEALIERTAKA